MTYPEFLEEWGNTSDYCRVHTSGSTGTPKEMLLEKALMKMSALRTLRFFNIPDGSYLHSCISPDFIGGKMMAVRAQEGGMQLTWEKPSNRPEVLSMYPDRIPALVALVPSQIAALLDQGIPARFNPTVWLVGGSAIDSALRQRIVASGIEAWESYGMTETASHIALRRVTSAEEPFVPLQGVDISLDSRGCLVIVQEGQEIVTNDIAQISGDRCFRILGRADNVIITGGRKVQPEEVEKILMGTLNPQQVSAVLLTGEPDEKWTTRLVLLAESSERSEPLRQEIEHKARTLLKPYQVPKEIRFVSRLPRTPNGKLKRT